MHADTKSQMLARMLLAQSITALEVFLSDSLIVTVANSPHAQGKLLASKDIGIGSKQIRLSDAVGVEDFATTALLEYLRAVSFHELKKANAFYRVGLGFNILPEADSLEAIQRFTRMRHDCVHKNGVDRESGELHQIDQESLLQLTNELSKMVESVDENVENCSPPPVIFLPIAFRQLRLPIAFRKFTFFSNAIHNLFRRANTFVLQY
ncbi:hypothetical protein EF888_17125 [Silicimonas algicola]|uniref:hypothetical protein n=1 Tax=Silicimonas algicola TaxID=1826607 RepID=UPI000F8597F6|nr:hypothetical protein [Silicimonas algicola]AZQ68698.1 hypothetical protein EF888_17125 [Silicimonas algicola]